MSAVDRDLRDVLTCARVCFDVQFEEHDHSLLRAMLKTYSARQVLSALVLLQSNADGDICDAFRRLGWRALDFLANIADHEDPQGITMSKWRIYAAPSGFEVDAQTAAAYQKFYSLDPKRLPN